MNVAVTLLETNCLSLSLAQNWSAPRLRYHYAMVAGLDVGQGLARRKRRCFCVGCWVWYLPHLTMGWRPPCSLGSGKRCPQALGSSPTWVVLMHGQHSALWSMTLAARTSAWGLWLHRNNLGPIQLNPSAVMGQGGGSWPDSHAPGKRCRQSSAPLLPQHHMSELSLHPTLAPCPSCTQA